VLLHYVKYKAQGTGLKILEVIFMKLASIMPRNYPYAKHRIIYGKCAYTALSIHD
jgi:hypothetical protein